LTISERRKQDQLEQALKPKQTFDDIVEKAKLIMPQILNEKAWSDQGRIDMPRNDAFAEDQPKHCIQSKTRAS